VTDRRDLFAAYVSVDVETAGPNPGQYSLLSIGACMVCDPKRTFYVELQPVNNNYRPSALSISGLSMEKLAQQGLPPAEAMARFETWTKEQVPEGQRPIFVAFNAPFDWMFVNDYFHRYIGHNPFGHNALDLKAFYMGMTGVSWEETAMRHVSGRYSDTRKLTHHALQDAVDQAGLFRNMLREAGYFDNEPSS
jgi:DNA polymerase III alpha subunit (gram-positive type)